jgi:hypothetical protein
MISNYSSNNLQVDNSKYNLIAGVICSIEIIHLSNGKIISALASMNVILIVSLEPIVRTIMKLERPVYVKEGYMPNISWGTGNLPSK